MTTNRVNFYSIAESFGIEEFYLIIGVLISFSFITVLNPNDYFSPFIYCALITLILTTLYYTRKFFINPNLKRLVYFTIMMCFIIFFYATLYKFFGIQNSHGLIPLKDINWHDALYFSTVTWTTLGYGDLSPINQLHFIASIEAMMGQIFMGLFMGKVLFILQQNHQ